MSRQSIPSAETSRATAERAVVAVGVRRKARIAGTTGSYRPIASPASSTRPSGRVSAGRDRADARQLGVREQPLDPIALGDLRVLAEEEEPLAARPAAPRFAARPG